MGIHMDDQSGGQILTNISIDNVEGVVFFTRDIDVHTLINVSWNPDFDESLVDYGHIGLSSDFKYRWEAQPPAINATIVPGGVQLSWPGWAKDMCLERSSTAESSGWTVLEGRPVEQKDQVSYIDSLPIVRAAFYRLKTCR